MEKNVKAVIRRGLGMFLGDLSFQVCSFSLLVNSRFRGESSSLSYLWKSWIQDTFYHHLFLCFIYYVTHKTSVSFLLVEGGISSMILNIALFVEM